MPPHCDALDGPVVNAARRALDAGDVTLILPYVKRVSEEELTSAFARTLPLHRDPNAGDVADLYFFETAVRLHRAGEGEHFTGLKPAGLDVGPVIPAAERAIASGSAEELSALLTGMVRHGIEEKLAHVRALKARTDGTVTEAREYVEAMLGLQVWSHKLYLAIHAEPHGEGGPAHEH